MEEIVVLVEETRLKLMKQLGNHETEVMTKESVVWAKRCCEVYLEGKVGFRMQHPGEGAEGGCLRQDKDSPRVARAEDLGWRRR